MITFKPVERHVSSPLKDAENYVHNMSNKKMAEILTERFEKYHCKDHPDFNNQMEVDLGGEVFNIKTISCCCDRFKEYLDYVSDNKDPFTPNEGFAF